MRKPSTIFLVFSVLFFAIVQLWIKVIYDDFLQSLIKVDSDVIHISKGNYIVYTSVKDLQGKCFELTGSKSNVNYEFIAVSRKGYIGYSSTLTLQDKVYYSQDVIDVQETDYYKVKIYNTNQAYILENQQAMDSLFEKNILLNYLWYLAMFLLVVSILIKVILLIKK